VGRQYSVVVCSVGLLAQQTSHTHDDESGTEWKLGSAGVGPRERL